MFNQIQKLFNGPLMFNMYYKTDQYFVKVICIFSRVNISYPKMMYIRDRGTVHGNFMPKIYILHLKDETYIEIQLQCRAIFDF